jgi:hypothetical protein
MVARTRKAPVPTETQVHRQVVDYLRKVGFSADVVWTHIRGERAGASQRIRAAQMGVTPKLPDFLFIYKGRVLFIELKKGGFSQKKSFNEHEISQMIMHERLRANGACVEVCETREDVISFLIRSGFPLRIENITSERIRRGFLTAMNEGAE